VSNGLINENWALTQKALNTQMDLDKEVGRFKCIVSNEIRKFKKTQIFDKKVKDYYDKQKSFFQTQEKALKAQSDKTILDKLKK